MPFFNTEQASHISKALLEIAEWFRAFDTLLRMDVYNYQQPLELRQLQATIGDFQTKFPQGNIKIDVELNTDELAFLKRALTRYRRQQANIIELNKEKTIHPDLIKMYNAQIEQLDDLLKLECLKSIAPLALPYEAEYIPVETLEAYNQPIFPQREYDEKFHILLSPKLFLQDLNYYRNRCELRRTALAVAYIDIDKFKSLNEKHTETEVDRLILPRFMRMLESHLYNHGFAYRQGGDEYVLLIPNISYSLCVSFLDELRQQISELEYPGTADRTTVSIGFCWIDADCHLTNKEILKLANDAKAFAKNSGRNCLATYNGSQFDPASLIKLKRSKLSSKRTKAA